MPNPEATQFSENYEQKIVSTTASKVQKDLPVSVEVL